MTLNAAADSITVVTDVAYSDASGAWQKSTREVNIPVNDDDTGLVTYITGTACSG